MNRVELQGGLTRDVELRRLDTGLPVIEMSVAVNEARWSKQEGKQTVTTIYVSCQAFGWLADHIAELVLCKGDEVYIVGKLNQRSVQRQDGTKEQKTRVDIAMLAPTRRRSAPPPQEAAPVYAEGEEPF